MLYTNICVYDYVYINTNTRRYIFKNKCYVYINIFISNLHGNIVKIYTVCFYIYIINIHGTCIYYVNKNLFRMRLIVSQHY